MLTQTSLDIVIVNWNSGELLSNCLLSISGSNTQSLRLNVTVIDNNSSDRSSFLDKSFTDSLKFPLKLISNSTNVGFAKACNQGAFDSTADYILFLNPDTKVYGESILQSVEFLNHRDNEKIGICGVQLLNDEGSISRSCSRFPSPRCQIATLFGMHYLFPTIFPKQLMTEWRHDNSCVVDQVMGAFFLIRSSLFKDLEGFDERFFVYFEEVDLSLRAKQKGWNSYYLSTSQIYHEGGGTTKSIRGLSLFYYLRSRILYTYKHFSFATATLLSICTLIIEPFPRIFYALMIGSIGEFLGVFNAYKYLYLWCVTSKNES